MMRPAIGILASKPLEIPLQCVITLVWQLELSMTECALSVARS